MELREICVTAYPRSGNTWLNRLLADILNGPMQTGPDAVIDWAGEGREGEYVVRKKHSLGHEKTENSKWVFIQRDPRDVAVSAMHYGGSPSLLLTLMSLLCRCEPGQPGKFRAMCVYERWVRSWLDCPGLADAITKYELLHVDAVHELTRIVGVLTGSSVDRGWVQQCVQRQSFDVLSDGQDHAMRKGVVGDWRDYFTFAEGHLMNDYLGEFMYEQGYIDKFNWWQELPIERKQG